jgi:hypothetical protein
MEQTVTFPAGNPPAWSAARDLLMTRGFRMQVRMIDGELAFPDEEPPGGSTSLSAADTAITVRSSLYASNFRPVRTI